MQNKESIGWCHKEICVLSIPEKKAREYEIYKMLPQVGNKRSNVPQMKPGPENGD